MRIPCIPVVALVLLAPAAAAAQYLTPYGPVSGAQVRVTAPTMAREPVPGRLVAFGGDSLVLDIADGRALVRLPVRAVTSVEVREEPDRAGTAFRAGAVGAVVGGVIGATSFGDNSLERMVGSLAFGATGLVIGAAGGGFYAPDRWRQAWSGPAVTSPGAARYSLSTPAGTDLRLVLRATGESVRGRAEHVAGDSLTVLVGDGVRHVALSDLATLQVRGGKDRRRGALIGAVALGAVTVVAGGVDLAHDNISAGDYAGTIAGNIAFGALLGAAFAPTGWLHVPLPGR